MNHCHQCFSKPSYEPYQSNGKNNHPLKNAQKFLKYFLEPFVIDESHADEFKQYIKKDKELLRRVFKFML